VRNRGWRRAKDFHFAALTIEIKALCILFSEEDDKQCVARLEQQRHARRLSTARGSMGIIEGTSPLNILTRDQFTPYIKQSKRQDHFTVLTAWRLIDCSALFCYGHLILSGGAPKKSASANDGPHRFPRSPGWSPQNFVVVVLIAISLR